MSAELTKLIEEGLALCEAGDPPINPQGIYVYLTPRLAFAGTHLKTILEYAQRHAAALAELRALMERWRADQKRLIAEGKTNTQAMFEYEAVAYGVGQCTDALAAILERRDG